MNVLFNDLKAQHAAYREEISTAVNRVLESGYYVGSPEVAEFEYQFAGYCGQKFVVGVGNGTDALSLAIMAADLGPGDEIIIPAVSAYPTAVGVLARGPHRFLLM